MHKSLHIAVRLLLWSLIGLGLALVLVFVRLDAGPVQLDWLKPRIERALTPDGGVVQATVARTELRLNQEAKTLELMGVDVRYRALQRQETAEGEGDASPFLVFPEVEVTLSAEAFLKRGMIAASEVVAKAPSLIVSRNEDGVIGLHSEAEDDPRFDDIDFGDFLRRFAFSDGGAGQAADKDVRLDFLKSLQISGGRVAYYDRTQASVLTAERADLVLTRQAGGLEGWLRASIAQPSGDPALVQLSGRIGEGDPGIAFEADIADLLPVDLALHLPLAAMDMPSELSGLRLPLRASIQGTLGLDGTLSPLDVDLEAAAGLVDLPGYLAEPLEVERAEIEGRLDLDEEGTPSRFDIDQASVSSRGAVFGGSGRIALGEDAPMLAFDLQASDVRAEDLAIFWPPDLGEKARAWVLENIETGLVSEAEISLDLQPGDFDPASRRDEAIEGRFRFEGLSVRYFETMPRLEEASGEASFDARRMDFDVEGGVNAGLDLKGGSVTITGMGEPGRLATQLQVRADIEGPIEQALTVLDAPPLNVAKDLSITPEAAGGSVRTSLDIRLPLHDEVTAEETQVLADATLRDVVIEDLAKLGHGSRLERGSFDLELEDDAVRLAGTADVDDVPLTIEVFEPLGEGGSKRRIDLAGNLEGSQLARLGLAVDGLDGAVGVEATVTETDTHFWIDLDADLSALGIAPPGLVFEKPAGQPGRLLASIAKPVDGSLEVRQFTIDAGDLSASGSLKLSASNDALEALTFDRFRLGDTDAAMRLSPDDQRGYEVEIEAKRLDLDALFAKGRKRGGSAQPFHAAIRADQLKLRGVEFVDVQADAVRASEGWRSASVIAAIPTGGRLVLELTPDGGDRRLELRSENAGALITALDLGQRVEGGDLSLSARLKSQDPVLAEGRFEIRDFVLKDAPLLARMLTLASLTGIGNLLGGEGMQMDHLILPFDLDDRSLTFTDGLLRGSQLGLTIKGGVELESETLDIAGTIIPVYSLNRLIGQVPVLGRILTGVDGRGAFAATYSIEGANTGPAVYVNPLSILTPGLLRDLFGGLLDGSLEPPDVRETDD